MKHKLKGAFAIEYEKFVRKEQKRSQNDLGELVRIGTIARYEFMEMVDLEVNLLWMDGKKKIKYKLDWAKSN